MSVWVSSLAPWSVIAHHTFRWEASLWSARRCYERFMKKELPELGYFYALEHNPSREGFHCHALWTDNVQEHAGVEVQRSQIWARWFKRYGRNKIEPVRSVADVADYCAKYVTKEGSWWNVQLRRSMPPQRPLPFVRALAGGTTGTCDAGGSPIYRSAPASCATP
jgi:hypothetical protein